MNSKTDLFAYAQNRHPLGDLQGPDSRPIYRILLFEHPNKERIYGAGTRSGFPDMECSMEAGFYYALDDAIRAMNENICDIHENFYDAGFILCQFPGLYESCGPEGRMYFVWDEEKKGFFQKEEPEIFKHIAL